MESTIVLYLMQRMSPRPYTLEYTHQTLVYASAICSNLKQFKVVGSVCIVFRAHIILIIILKLTDSATQWSD